jgi:hypothetical protein
VLNAINGLSRERQGSRRPANAAPIVLPISRTGFDLAIIGLAPVNQDLKDAIEAAVDEYLRRRERYIVGVTSLPRTDLITVGTITGVIEEVASAAGSAFSSIVLESTLGPGDCGHSTAACGRSWTCRWPTYEPRWPTARAAVVRAAERGSSHERIGAVWLSGLWARPGPTGKGSFFSDCD